MKDFVHLHNHSYYSILDGISSPEDLVKTCAEKEFKAMSITDHGSCGGWYLFQKACKNYNIKPILGSEFYTCKDYELRDKNDPRYHLVLLAKNQIGLKNLMQLSTISEIKGKYFKPRIDFELLKKHHEGLVCLSACSAGELPSKIWQGDDKGAELFVDNYKELFGDDFYIEIMMHKYNQNSQEQEKRERVLAKKLYQLSKKKEVKAICTNDCHYSNKSDAICHDIILAIQTRTHIKNPKRFTFNSNEFYLKSYDEMFSLYKNAPELLLNTLEIEEKIEKDAILQTGQDLLPAINLPNGFKTEEQYLKTLIKEGMKSKGLLNKKEYRERIKQEVDLIVSCGFVRYFLVLWDVINFANQSSIAVGVGRGSGAGSLALYCLGVTKIDPIKYDLLFERFINPERVSPPDVDLDFDYYRRDEIFNYLYNKYGQENCCRIGTYMKYKAKAAVRFTAKAIDIGKDWDYYTSRKAKNKDTKVEMTKNSLDIADYIAKLIPDGMTIEQAYENDEEFRKAMNKYPDLFKKSKSAEGIIASSSVHAAGIIVCKEPVVNHIPLRISGDKKKRVICSQFDKKEVEDLGLLKFDILAIKTLTVIDETVKLVKERYGKEIDIDNLEPNDKKVLAIFNCSYPTMDTRGIFQFEGYGATKILKQIHVDSFEDIVVCNAINRPGPLGAKVHELYSDYKHGTKEIKCLHPKMKEVLKKTFGTIIYQEDVMRISQKLAGFTLGQADILRKIIGKKEPELLKKEKLDEKFINGCKEHSGISENISKEIFAQIEFFGGYGFNRCLSGDTTVKDSKNGKVYSLEELEGKFLDNQLNNFDEKDVINKVSDDMDINLLSIKDGEIVEDKVVDVFEVGTMDIYEVELDNGVIIKCTMDHKFICSDNKSHTLEDIMEKDLEILYQEEK